MSTTHKITDVEREILTAWKEAELMVVTGEAPADIMNAVRRYARTYARYRLGLVASQLWDGNQFGASRAVAAKADEVPA